MAVALLVVGLSRAGDLPMFSGGRATYRAEFSDAGGLRPGDPVKVAGVRAGVIDDIRIDDDRVVITFDLDGAVTLGDRTSAAVASGSLLGDKYLRITPAGDGSTPEDGLIPLARTTAPYDVVDAFADLTTTTGKLDKDGIAEALDTLSATFAESPDEVRAALDGLTRFSVTVSSRDEDLNKLLRHAANVTSVLDRRKGDLTALVRQSNLLLDELSDRRAAIHDVLVHTRSLSDQLRGVVRDNQAAITPALTHLEGVTDVLVTRQRELGQVIRDLEVYGRYYTNVVGSGPWFDNYIPRAPGSIQVEVD